MGPYTAAGTSVPRLIHLLGAYPRVDLVLLTTLLVSQALILTIKLLTQLHFYNPPNIGEVPLTISRLERQPPLTLADGSIAIHNLTLELLIPRQTQLVGKLGSIKACLGKRKGRTQSGTSGGGRRLSYRSTHI